MPTPTPSHTKRDPKGRFARRTTRVGTHYGPGHIWDGTPDADCRETDEDFVCSRFRHNEGPHVATITGGLIVHVWGDRG